MREKERILVLDNSEKWRATIKRILKPEYSVTLTGTPEQAIKELKAASYSLVILDKNLPRGISGLQVLSQMQKIVPYLRAIILTGYPDDDSELESGRKGALGYVPKGSFDLATELKSKVSTIIHGGNSPNKKARTNKDRKSILKTRVKSLMAARKKPIQIFLSYQSNDRKRVVRLRNDLRRLGFSPWMDIDNIEGGKEWNSEIIRAIKESDFFIACLSPNSLNKRSVIQKEFKLALAIQKEVPEGGTYLIPTRLTDCKIPEQFSRLQHIDLFKKGMFYRLVESLISREVRKT